MTTSPPLSFEASYARDLDGLYVPWRGADVPDPRILRFNAALADDLGLPPGALAGDIGAAYLSGSAAPPGTTPLAMAYAGHQFGHYSPRLGDGRALLVGELIDRSGRRRDLHLKGSGRTPFSRGGDGKAVLGPVLREYLVGEAMHALGIPTTRALAAVTTGESILRDDGFEPGAVLARVAASHIRIGTFQYFAARGETEPLTRLAEHAIARHDPDLLGRPDRHLRMLERVVARQATLVAKWMLIGFVHGVMNTDNMTVSGETIDYGPCAFLDTYDPAAVFSSIDRGGRYAYRNQPPIAGWNLARFAETLLDLIHPDPDEAVRLASETLSTFPALYRAEWAAGMRAKLGLAREDPTDVALAEDLLAVMAAAGADFTATFRALVDVAADPTAPDPAALAAVPAYLTVRARWLARLATEETPAATRRAAMRRANPRVVPRNHVLEAALRAARDGDMAPFDRLLAAVSAPFDDDPASDDLAAPPPPGTPRCRTFCGT